MAIDFVVVPFFEVLKVNLDGIPERVIFGAMVCIALEPICDVLLNRYLVSSLKVNTTGENNLQVGMIRL